MLTLRDIPNLYRHEVRHSSENGTPGDPLFGPYEAPKSQLLEDFEKEKRVAWSKTTRAVGWERCWGVREGNEIKGHLLLKHFPRLPTSLHRATLEMGIEKFHRHTGHGSRLIETAIEWALTESELQWLDLRVFEENSAARKLYEKMGFVETGRVTDCFRVFGRSITDISMSREIHRRS
jgi:RimJ/RimL family protein N-acetyltransferase